MHLVRHSAGSSDYPSRFECIIVRSLIRAPVNSSRWLGDLQPAADGRLIFQVLGTEFPFQVLLFFRYDDSVDQRHRSHECSQQPHAVDPDRDTELEYGERKIDRVPAETI